MDNFRAQQLLEKYKNGTLTQAEEVLLDSWYISLGKEMDGEVNSIEMAKDLAEVHNHLKAFRKARNPERAGLYTLYRVVGAAACLVLFCGIILYFYRTMDRNGPSTHLAIDKIMPGGNRANLILSNGKNISLDQLKIGELEVEGGITIRKLSGDFVAYNPGELLDGASTIRHHTIYTPRAGQFRLVLSDGTKVWLNSASRINFPTEFSDKERVVEIDGEAYFDVAKKAVNGKRVPFKVISKLQEIEVLGTRFNVKTYHDETNITTTLLEGSVKVDLKTPGQKSVLLKPGEQIKVTQRDSLSTRNINNLTIAQADTSTIVAWKDGYFRFNNTDLPELLNQISRWYDVEIEYSGETKKSEFVGQIPRNTPLAKVLTILKTGDVDYRIEGKKIIVVN